MIDSHRKEKHTGIDSHVITTVLILTMHTWPRIWCYNVYHIMIIRIILNSCFHGLLCKELFKTTALSGNNWQQNIINHKSAIGHAQVFNLRLGMLAKHVLYYISILLTFAYLQFLDCMRWISSNQGPSCNLISFLMFS